MNRPAATLILLIAAVAFTCRTAWAVERFPPPQFETGYEMPSPTTPSPRAEAMEYVDLAALAVALSVAAWLALKTRSRRMMFVWMLVCLAYFGFYRKGCVCSIGAIQNVALGIFDGGYAVPLTIVAFFALPLVFTLLFGRVFCAAVCPLGAIQDLVLLKPVRLPGWLDHSLRLLAWVFLAAAVLFAATGSVFLICQYDPFVGLFRFHASATMLILAGCILLIGVFVGRPYCRFLCPYGAIMRPLSHLSKWRVTITPDECVPCRLCEDACPFGAIDKPFEALPHARKAPSRKRLAVLLLASPALVVLGGFVASRAAVPLSRMHYDVRLAEQIQREQADAQAPTTPLSDAFRRSGASDQAVLAAAQAKRHEFLWGAWLAGGFIGLVVAGKLITLSIHRPRKDYEANRAQCLACGRCFEYCPIEKQRRSGAQIEIRGRS